MEKEIAGQLGCFTTSKSIQLSINKQCRNDLNDIVNKSHEIVQKVSLEIYKYSINSEEIISRRETLCFDTLYNKKGLSYFSYKKTMLRYMKNAV